MNKNLWHTFNNFYYYRRRENLFFTLLNYNIITVQWENVRLFNERMSCGCVVSWRYGREWEVSWKQAEKKSFLLMEGQRERDLPIWSAEDWWWWTYPKCTSSRYRENWRQTQSLPPRCLSWCPACTHGERQGESERCWSPPRREWCDAGVVLPVPQLLFPFYFFSSPSL